MPRRCLIKVKAAAALSARRVVAMSRGRHILAAFAAALLLAGLADARAQEPAARGRALLKEYCARCHAIDRLDTSPHRAAPPFRVIGESFDLDRFARQLRRGLASSHPEMPEFHFNADDADAVVAYLRTIQQ